MGSSYLPPPEQNVVNVGDELSQSAIDAINAASFPSSSNPFRTINDGGVISAYDNFKVYQAGEVVTEGGLIYVFNSFIGAAGYGPTTHPYAWTSMKGDPGDPGPQGPQGDPGPAGPSGSDGQPGVSTITWRGEWFWGTTYNVGDIVSYQGSSWGATSSSYGATPDTYGGYWQIVAQKGQDGSSGSDGAQGPQGDPGPVGPQGPAGPPGALANEYNPNGVSYYVGDVVSYQNDVYTCISDISDSSSYGPPWSEIGYWRPSGDSAFIRKYPVEGADRNQNISGKITIYPAWGYPGINIGIGGTSNLSTSPGDLWIPSGGTSLNYRDATGSWRQVLTTSQAGIIDVSSASTALRITQRGSGESFRVEDSTSPDATAFVISTAGKVGIGVAPDAVADLRVSINGIMFASNTMRNITTNTNSSVGGMAADGYPDEVMINIDGITFKIPARTT